MLAVAALPLLVVLEKSWAKKIIDSKYCCSNI